MSDTSDPNRIPTDAELDALQAQIERAQADAAKRAPTEECAPTEERAPTEKRAPTQARKPLSLNPDAPGAAEATARAAEISAEMDRRNASSDARVAELELELATLKDRALRAMADAENTKKRSEREVANAKVYGVERFAADVLGVYDNLARALASVDDTARAELGPNAKTLLEGIELTEKNLMAVLARHGVRAVAGVGSKFDPNVHQAVAQIPSSEEKGHVAEVMQTGFTIGDRTLRAAMVAVSTGAAGAK